MRHIQQKTERRISAALRLVMVAVLLLLQIGLVVTLSLVLRQRMYLAYIVLEIAGIVCAFHIYNRPGGNTYKPGWMLLVLTVPVVGLMLYWLWNGGKMKKKLDLKAVSMPEEPRAMVQSDRRVREQLASALPNWSRTADYLSGQDMYLYRNTRAEYLPTGEAYLEDLIEKLEGAEHFIFMEYYIVGVGRIWSRIRDILERKAQQGVEVRLLFADFGSMMRLPQEELDRLQRAGVDVKLFNPVHHYVNRLYFNYRDHRKIAVIDGNTAYTGGANLADEYANLTVRFGYWKDSGVRLEGEGAWGLTRQFMHMWLRNGGALEREWDYYRPTAGCTAEGYCQPLVDGPDNNPIDTAEDTFLHMITGARRQVWITSPYLAVDEAMIRALCLAADSGVDVRLMMPGIPDHKIAFDVAQSYYGELLQHGVKIYQFTPGLLHAKTVAADGETAFVGSVNMDYRSFQLHFECGCVFYGCDVVDQVRQDMENIMEKSRLVDYDAWKKRPWLHRTVGYLMKPFAAWM